MKKEKILITGAGGFIGHHLARFLKSKGYWVRGVDIKKPMFSCLDDFNQFLVADLRNYVSSRNVFKGIDEVYALAAVSGGIEFTTKIKTKIVSDNTLINLNTAKHSVSERVKRLFFSSSACVYPLSKQSKLKTVPIKEDDVYPAFPDSEYGWEKLFAERMYKSYEDDYGFETRIARLFNIYGPENIITTMRSSVIMALTKKVIKAGDGGIVKIWGDGKQTRSFCYVDDCVSGIYKLMRSSVNEPINIGTKDLLSINKLVDIISEVEKVKVKKQFQLNKFQGVRNRPCDTTKAKKLLNWERKVKMKEGLIKVNKFVYKELKGR